MPIRYWGALVLGWAILGVAPAAAARSIDTLRVAPGSRSAGVPPDSTVSPVAAVEEVALGDVLGHLFPRLRTKSDTAAFKPGHKYIVVLPVVSYTLQTRALVQLTSSTAWRQPDANMSTVVAALTYTQNKQLILNAASSVWLADNKFNLVGDWRLMHYPQNTYGLGMHTHTYEATYMDYEYLRLYQNVLRKVRPNLYAGLGYQLDYHWGIESRQGTRLVSEVSDYRPGVQGKSVSSGVALNALYDSRGNAINPQGGLYVNLLYRPNFRGLGSDANYQSLLLDARKYLHLRPESRNVLALWSYNAFVFGGDAPFLDLPSTGWDTYNNTGRGYIQGRFRGRNLLYSEAEYRFGITRNRLLGGVVFVNAQTASEPAGRRFDKVAPAGGVGLRLNMNKLSHTNLTVDYGFGIEGSRGLWFNFGEVF